MSFGIRRRARRADQFVQIENAFLRDETLSIEARGVGAYLLTHSEGFRVSAAYLGKATGLGRDKLRRVIGELEQAGYLLREHSREAGRFTNDEYSMSDEKSLVGTSDWKTATADQSLVIAPHKKTNSENTNEKNTAPQGGSATPPAEPEIPLPEDGGLFVEPEHEKKQGPEREPAPFSAKDVVAAYVDSFRAHAANSADPPLRFIKQVGREAKAMIEGGTAEELLLQAAKALGQTAYASLERQVAIELQGGVTRRGDARGAYRNDAWEADAVAERDENGFTAEDRYVMERHGATITYGHQK